MAESFLKNLGGGSELTPNVYGVPSTHKLNLNKEFDIPDPTNELMNLMDELEKEGCS